MNNTFDNSRQDGKPKKVGRFQIFIIITAVFVAVLLYQYISIMLVGPKPERPSTLARPMVERGPILDRNGRILAIQTKLYSVTAWTPHIEESEETAEILADVLDLDPEILLTAFREREGFMYVKRKITPSTSRRIRAEKEAGRLKGISLEPEAARSYPEKNLASQIIGYVGVDNSGLAGLEYTYNNELSPDPEETTEETVYGNQLFLTLDMNVQFFAERIAEAAYTQHSADSVMILVMDTENGDILASASKPDFDPNNFAEAPVEIRQNRAVTVAYEPGSVFKVFTMASILELGGIEPDETFYCDGTYEIEIPGGENETISDLRPHGVVDAQRIIQYSCNVGMAYASERVDPESFYGMLRSFGFGFPTGLPFSGETHGQLRRPSAWSVRSKPTIAFGQEIGVSAVQVVTAATALANGGILLRPHIIKKIVAPDGTILETFDREPVKQVIAPTVANRLLAMMETATEPAGTAREAAVDGIRISAKTGTGEMLDERTGKYSEEAFLASTLALFPTDEPRYIVYVVIDHPKGEEYYGSRIAAPVVREVIDELATYYGIPRTGDIIVRHPGRISVENRTEPVFDGTMPDLRGMSKRELLPVLKKEPYRFEIYGSGWVVDQEPSPGSPLEEGDEIILRLDS
jgi:cell division protein FtsI (penicillin-binding protein 3)